MSIDERAKEHHIISIAKVVKANINQTTSVLNASQLADQPIDVKTLRDPEWYKIGKARLI